MDLPGRSASAFVSLSLLILFLSGCTGRTGGQYETYNELQKADQQSKVQSLPAAAGLKVQSQESPTPARQQSASPNDKAPVASVTAKPSQPSRQDSTPIAMAKPSTAPPPEIARQQAPTTPSARAQTAGALSKGSNQLASGNASASGERKPQVLIPTMSFKPEGAEAAWRVSYNDLDLLKVLNMDPVTPEATTLMPAWLKGLDGRRIRIRGFMYPTFQQSGIRAFALARDNQICCFGRHPKIYDVFDVMLREGVTTSYLPNRPFDVVGVFHIRPELEDGKLYRIYEMDDAVIVTR
jgi:hypothetical protein